MRDGFVSFCRFFAVVRAFNLDEEASSSRGDRRDTSIPLESSARNRRKTHSRKPSHPQPAVLPAPVQPAPSDPLLAPPPWAQRSRSLTLLFVKVIKNVLGLFSCGRRRVKWG